MAEKRKLAIEIITKLCLFDAEKRNVWEQELLLQELKNAFLKLIDVSRNKRIHFNRIWNGTVIRRKCGKENCRSDQYDRICRSNICCIWIRSLNCFKK